MLVETKFCTSGAHREGRVTARKGQVLKKKKKKKA